MACGGCDDRADKLDAATPNIKLGTKIKKVTKATGLYTLAGWLSKRNANQPKPVITRPSPRKKGTDK